MITSEPAGELESELKYHHPYRINTLKTKKGTEYKIKAGATLGGSHTKTDSSNN